MLICTKKAILVLVETEEEEPELLHNYEEETATVT